MDVFGAALGESGQFLRDAAISAAYELGLFERLASPHTIDELADSLGIGAGRRRLRALVELLVGLGVFARAGAQGGVPNGELVGAGGDGALSRERFVRLADTPPRVDVARAGWGLLADVIRNDRPLDSPGGEHARRMHEHLAEAGAAAAYELAARLHRELDAMAPRPAAQLRAVTDSATDVDAAHRSSTRSVRGFAEDTAPRPATTSARGLADDRAPRPATTARGLADDSAPRPGPATAGSLAEDRAPRPGPATAGSLAEDRAPRPGPATAGSLAEDSAPRPGPATAGSLAEDRAPRPGPATAGSLAEDRAPRPGPATAGSLAEDRAPRPGPATAGSLAEDRAPRPGPATAGSVAEDTAPRPATSSARGLADDSAPRPATTARGLADDSAPRPVATARGLADDSAPRPVATGRSLDDDSGSRPATSSGRGLAEGSAPGDVDTAQRRARPIEAAAPVAVADAGSGGQAVGITFSRTSTGRIRRITAQQPPLTATRTLLDLGGGAGAYTAAWLAANDDAHATLVDYPEVIELANEYLTPFVDRVTFVASDARSVDLGDAKFSVVVLANLLHLHGPEECAQLCAVAARACAPGGLVVVKDLRIDNDRSGPIEGLLFALNMAVYTGGGDVYSAAQIGEWLRAAGLEGIAEQRLEIAPDAFAIVGRRPAVASEVDIERVRRQVASRLSRVGKVAWRELAAEGRLRDGAQPRHLQFPDAFERTLARAFLEGAQDVAATDAIANHYLETLPRMRVAQIVSTDEPGATLMHTPLDWEQLPRMSAAIDRVYAVLAAADVEPTGAVGAPTPNAFRASSRTCAELFMATHYGACMPLLYGYPPDLAYFASRGLGTMATIDRYLTAPLVHELCHFGRGRAALPTHLDECIGGWLGVHVWPEFAFPAGDHDDAIPYAPLLAQVGQAFARAFGVRALVRAQSGAIAWREALPARVVTAAETVCSEDWRARRTLHFLSDTSQPRPWVALALAGGAGHNLAVYTVASLAHLPIARLALPEDAAFDRTIVGDALRAMCLVTAPVDGSLRTRAELPAQPITIDATASTVCCGDHTYWLPPSITRSYRLTLHRTSAIDDAAAAICAGSSGAETDDFSLAPAG